MVLSKYQDGENQNEWSLGNPAYWINDQLIPKYYLVTEGGVKLVHLKGCYQVSTLQREPLLKHLTPNDWINNDDQGKC